MIGQLYDISIFQLITNETCADCLTSSGDIRQPKYLYQCIRRACPAKVKAVEMTAGLQPSRNKHCGTCNAVTVHEYKYKAIFGNSR